MILLLLYPLSLAACVLTLSLWFYYQQKSFLGKVLRGAFFLSLLVYLLAWLLHAGDWNAKTAILVRDLIILGAVPAVLSFLKNRSVAFFSCSEPRLPGLAGICREPPSTRRSNRPIRALCTRRKRNGNFWSNFRKALRWSNYRNV